jgi:hypothetical protein
MIYIKDGVVTLQDKGLPPGAMVYCRGAVTSEEAAMMTLQWRCSADLPTRQAVQMAREASRRCFILPETVSHPAVDYQVMSLAYLLMAYGLAPEPHEPARIITERKRAIGKASAAVGRPAGLALPGDYGADTGIPDTLATTAAEPAMVAT